MAPSIPNDIFQFSTLAAHVSGFHTGQPHTRDLTSHGTHGIGIYEDSSLMILLDRSAYAIRKDGTAVPAPLDDKLPFAMVTVFQPTYRFKLPSLSLEELEALVEAQDLGVARGVNTLMPFQISTTFSSVALEQGGSLHGVEGTIFGYVVPKWMREISGPRIHAHFLNEEESKGGRVEGFEVEGEVHLGFAKCGRFHLGFPQGPEWEDVRLSSD
ncbi:alpha-acetolactate decarboxylase [Ampelomyces quisqualis]|uniref:Alpha-acetolactate decarboxylase n=1 Tax=Ampelomyces quisqualis TaxID=50730 RepID=A0A6A5QXQ9_AMPQU|nr:alpha-acetolactate decarboxylase [Ampelomyces quisqualis]